MGKPARVVPYTVICPHCEAAPRSVCRTPSGRTTDVHVARLAAQYPPCVNCGLRETTHPIETCRTFQPTAIDALIHRLLDTQYAVR